MRISKKKVISIFIIFLIVTSLYIYYQTTHRYDVRFIDGTTSQLTVNELQERAQKDTDESINSFQIETNLVFDITKNTSNIYINNKTSNNSDMQVRIYLDNGTLILKTDNIAPNKMVVNTPLKEVFPQGNYTGKAIVNFFNNKQNSESEVEVSVQII